MEFDASEEWQGIDGLAEELIAERRGAVETTMKKFLLLYEGRIKKKLTGARTGRARRVTRSRRRKGSPGGATKMHVASAPGEPPAVLYGALRNSVGHAGPTWDHDILEGKVGVGLGISQAGGGEDENEIAKAYARRLEYGGVDKRGVRILPRPYLAPVTDEMEPIMDKMFREAL